MEGAGGTGGIGGSPAAGGGGRGGRGVFLADRGLVSNMLVLLLTGGGAAGSTGRGGEEVHVDSQRDSQAGFGSDAFILSKADRK